ncbi:MAG: M20 family metallopeptidase [Thermoplasmataceae archaeon]
MSDSVNSAAKSILSNLTEVLPALESVYRDIHSHPELSMAEFRTAGIVADILKKSGYEVSEGIGKTGVVGVLKNGEGPTVLIRADMDALPVSEKTNLPYASNVTTRDATGASVPVMHACGHDMHVTCLIGAAQLFSRSKDKWNGTVMVLFQPSEETGKGAQAMIDDGLTKKFPKPDVILGQHVMVGSAGVIGWKSGTVTSASDSLEIRMFGRGAHGSMPQASIDPVVMSASTVMRLQTIVSREVAPSSFAVLTVGSLQAGTKDNVIPDEAVIKLNIRTRDERVRSNILSAINRIVDSEALASGSQKKPEISQFEHYSLVSNDPDATHKVVDSFIGYFTESRVKEVEATSASEDFGAFGTAWGSPSVFWFVGSTDPDLFARAEKEGKIDEIPTNHNPGFAPVIHPTLETGVQAIVMAAGAWIFKQNL